MKKTALVTGANKGLGLETSKVLAKKGIKVFMGARNENRGKAAAAQLQNEGLDVVFVSLDVADPESIKNAAAALAESCDTLDILVNNAGTVHQSEDWVSNSSLRVPMEGLRSTFETNFFGLIDLTRQLLPLLRKSEHANIVNVSSILGSLNFTNDPSSMIYATKPLAYNSSKTALNAFTVHLATALKEDNISVNSAHPGWVKTDMGTDAAPMELPEGASTIVALALNASPAFTGRFIHMGKDLPW